MSLKAKIEAIIYAAEEPITVEQISTLVKDLVLAEQAEAATAAAEAAAEESAAAEAAAQAETSAPAATAQDEAADSSDVIVTEIPTPATEGEEAAPQAASDETQAPEQAESPSADESAVAEAGTDEPAPAESAAENAPDTKAAKKQKKELSEDAKIRAHVRKVIEELMADYDSAERGMEIRAVAGGYRMATRPEHHDVVRAFAKSLKPPVRLSLAALETLAVIAYKQPVTVPEISEIRGVESGGVIGTLLDRKLITTAGRKQVVGRPILYKTSKDFLMRFGLNDVNELPSMEEFEKLASDGQGDLFTPEAPNVAGLTTMEANASVAPQAAAAAEDGAAEAEQSAVEQAAPEHAEATEVATETHGADHVEDAPRPEHAPDTPEPEPQPDGTPDTETSPANSQS